jgi:hypothetical protein
MDGRHEPQAKRRRNNASRRRRLPNHRFMFIYMLTKHLEISNSDQNEALSVEQEPQGDPTSHHTNRATHINWALRENILPKAKSQCRKGEFFSFETKGLNAI